MARSSPGSRRAAAGSSDDPRAPRARARDVGSTSVPWVASATLPRVWQGIGYRPLADAAVARPLFEFAATPWPSGNRLELGWGAYTATTAAGELVGAAVGERHDLALFLHGPVVVSGAEPIETAAQLVAAVLEQAGAIGVETVFTRPQGLDRVWVRFGFIPVPEGALPSALAGRPGRGLHAWRGGTALWTFRESTGH